MNKFKFIRNYLVIVTSALLLFSCSEDNFLNDNLERTGRAFPVIADIQILNNQPEFTAGESVQIFVSFTSTDPVSEIVLFDSLVNIRALQEVLREPASNAVFSDDSQTYEITLVYTVPDVPENPTTIRFEIEVINENGLTQRNTESIRAALRNIQITAVP